MDSAQGSVAQRIRAQFPHWIIATHAYRGDETVILKREGLLEICRFLRDDPALAFEILMDLTGVDYLTFGQRLESEPTMSTPSPLPYFMRPKPTLETWDRLPAPPPAATMSGAQARLPHDVRRGQAGQVGPADRFEIVYHLYSLSHRYRLRLKVPLTDADPTVDSLTGLWKSADWFEREVWDMFGIRFVGHPNLTRILMYEPFDGHPLRKDYPVNKRQPLIGPVN